MHILLDFVSLDNWFFNLIQQCLQTQRVGGESCQELRLDDHHVRGLLGARVGSAKLQLFSFLKFNTPISLWPEPNVIERSPAVIYKL
jgi:hypothetical protein